MKDIFKITADVYCSPISQGESYRLYVDNDMLTERTFAWPGHKEYVEENIIVALDPGQHTVRLEPCKSKQDFILTNIQVNGKPTDPTFTI